MPHTRLGVQESVDPAPRRSGRRAGSPHPAPPRPTCRAAAWPPSSPRVRLDRVHPRKVDAPPLAPLGGATVRRLNCLHRRPRDRHSTVQPSSVVGRVVDRSAHAHGRAQPSQVERDVRLPLVAVRPVHRQVAHGVERVDLKFEVVAAVAAGVDEHLERLLACRAARRAARIVAATRGSASSAAT